jgi:hypothetical protein
MTVRDIATVVCNTPVSGGRRRKAHVEYRARSSHVEAWRVHPDVMRAARAALRPGERIEIVSPTRVDIVTDRRR